MPRVLQMDERRKLPFTRGLHNVAVRFGTECVQDQHIQLDAWHIRLDWRKYRINWNPRLLGQLAIPEGIEVSRTRIESPILNRATAAPTA